MRHRSGSAPISCIPNDNRHSDFPILSSYLNCLYPTPTLCGFHLGLGLVSLPMVGAAGQLPHVYRDPGSSTSIGQRCNGLSTRIVEISNLMVSSVGTDNGQENRVGSLVIIGPVLERKAINFNGLSIANCGEEALPA